jgi:CRISPR-associated protein Cmr2
LSALGGERPGAFYCKEVKIKNIFNPAFSVDLSEEEPKEVNKFFNILHEIIAQATNPRIAWHLLYSLYEALWIRQSYATGPADTRNPTHSIFDHCYASAMVTNWLVKSSEPKGILLALDIAGVQGFISASRKLRDLWAASYFVSSLLWSIAWLFIEKVGPDVLITPTCRDNPFYYHSLLSMLRESKLGADVVKEITEICKELLNYDPEKEIYPTFAVIPGTIMLILPDLEVLNELLNSTFKNIEDLEEFIKSKYSKTWKQLYEALIESIRSDKDLGEEFTNEIPELLNSWSKYGFNDVPPLHLRVISVTIDEAIISSEIAPESPPYLLYDLMVRKLHEKLKKEKRFKYRPEAKLELTKLTESAQELTWPIRSERGFDYCTICGKLPALLIMPPEGEYERRFSEKKTNLRILFSPGEKLCPYCLLKRLFSRYAGKFIGLLLGQVSKREFKYFFPSVSDIASVEFKEAIVRAIKTVYEKDTKKGDEILVELGKLTEHIVPPASLSYSEKLWLAQSKLAGEVCQLEGKAEASYLLPLYQLIYGDAELMYFASEESRTRWNNFLKRNFDKLDIKFPMRSYYSLIKSDADNIGKLISGKIEEATRLPLNEYIGGLLEGRAGEAVASILKDRLDEAEATIRKYIKDDAARRVKEAKDLLKKLIDSQERRIIMSPSYHAMISRALMRAALRDLEIIRKHKGVIIYAGGDDLLALTPVSEELMAVCDTRKSFGLGSVSCPGFEMIGKNHRYYVPSLISTGRSYSVTESHYMYPLYSVMERTVENLESRAKNAQWKVQGSAAKLTKDSLVLSYSARGGGEQSSLLPLNLMASSGITPGNMKIPAQNVNMLHKMVNDLEEGVFSTSMIYDIQKNMETLNALLQTNEPEILEKVLIKIFERNHPKQNESIEEYVNYLIKEYVNYLIRNGNAQVSYDSEPSYLLVELFNGLQIVKSGLRSRF